MKRVSLQVIIILVLVKLTACIATTAKEKPQPEAKTLSVAEAYIEKQIAQLKFCEAIFKSDLFQLSEQEKVVQGRSCYFLWHTNPEEITRSYLNYEESAHKLASALTTSREKAQELGWIEKAGFLFDLSAIKESGYLEIEERCKYLMQDGYLTDKQIDICIASFRNQHLLTTNSGEIQY